MLAALTASAAQIQVMFFSTMERGEHNVRLLRSGRSKISPSRNLCRKYTEMGKIIISLLLRINAQYMTEYVYIFSPHLSYTFQCALHHLLGELRINCPKLSALYKHLTIMFISNGRHIDCLSLTHGTSKRKILTFRRRNFLLNFSTPCI
jgi:hypothetical protein